MPNIHVAVLDYETDIKTKEGDGRYIVLVEMPDGEQRKFFTNNAIMKQQLDFAREMDKIPFGTTIKPNGSYGYIFT